MNTVIYPLGAIKSPNDDRDWSVQVAKPVVLPPSIRLAMPVIENQGQVGNCVAQAVRPFAEIGIPGIIFVTDVTDYYTDEYHVWHNNTGIGHGRHMVAIVGYEPHQIANGAPEMAYIRNSWGEWGKQSFMGNGGGDGYCWMHWNDVFRDGEVWAYYPPNHLSARVPMGVDMVYGRYRTTTTPGMQPREMLSGLIAEGIAPRKADPGNTEVTTVIKYAKETDADRLLKVAQPYSGGSYYRINTVEQIKAVLYEAWQLQQGSPAPSPVIKRPTLRLKTPYMTGDDVKYCQTRLIVHNQGVAVDGTFGPKTDKAVRAFQTAANLTSDGIVGAKTWEALDKAPDDKPTKYDIDAVESLMGIMVGDHYVIGGQGHEMTESYIKSRMAAQPGYFTNGRGEWLIECAKLATKLGRVLRCEDCSGLVMKANEVLHFIPHADLTAQGIWGLCTPITKSEVSPGDMLFRKTNGNITHIAWVGKKGVYEAAGTAYGVVFRESVFGRVTLNQMTGSIDTLKDWTDFGRLK